MSAIDRWSAQRRARCSPPRPARRRLARGRWRNSRREAPSPERREPRGPRRSSRSATTSWGGQSCARRFLLHGACCLLLFAQGPKSPHSQSASNDHCNPGGGHWYVEASDMHCPLIRSTYSLKHSDHTEEDTCNDDILTRHFDPPVE